MTSPSKFIQNSDFATLKNQGSVFGSVFVPGSVSIPGNGYVEYHTDVSIGQGGSILRARIRTTRSGNVWLVHPATSESLNGVNSGSPALYTIDSFIWQPSPGILRFQVLIQNPYSSTTTGDAASETFDFFVNTFLPPFA